ncbi:MAG: hypothetical protein QXK57_01460 [Conexivisphaerales archaeon]
METKSAWNGYKTVDAYGTSKTCSRCGYYNKVGQAHLNVQIVGL